MMLWSKPFHTIRLSSVHVLTAVTRQVHGDQVQHAPHTRNVLQTTHTECIQETRFKS